VAVLVDLIVAVLVPSAAVVRGDIGMSVCVGVVAVTSTPSRRVVPVAVLIVVIGPVAVLVHTVVPDLSNAG
jgi:hypothetical protein